MSDAVIEVVRPSAHRVEIWLNRPDVRNAFNDEVVKGLHQAFADVAKDDQVRAVMIGGRGKAFCAGGDLRMMRASGDFTWEQNYAGAQAMADMMAMFDACPVPVVARVHGDCYAGGMGLVSLADIVVAVPDITFCLSEARLGLLPATISPYVVRAMGYRQASRYFVTAERFDARRAHEIGFVQELAGSEELDARVDAILTSIETCGPQGVRQSKKLVRDVHGQDLTPELRAETARRIADIRASDEGKEGVSSFLEKRQPNWLV